MNAGFALPLFKPGVGGIIMLLMTDRVNRRGRHCGACTVMVFGLLCQDGNAKASKVCRERQELPL